MEIIRFETDDVCRYLTKRYDRFPEGARLFHGRKDVTPRSEPDVAALEKLSGEFTLSITPKAPLVGYAVATLVSIGVGMLLRPKIEMPEEEDPYQVPGSPTNALARLGNRERLGERVPDIYGTVKSTPDLLAPVFKRWENGEEVHYTLLCLGRGTFTDPTITDGEIDIADIVGYGAKVFAPGVELDGTAQDSVGDDFDLDDMFWKRIEGAEFEDIPPYNDKQNQSTTDATSSKSNLYVRRPDYVTDERGHITSIPQEDDSSDANYHDHDLSADYAVGMRIQLSSFSEDWHAGVPDYDASGLAGFYTVLKVTRTDMWLQIPDSELTGWNAMPASHLNASGGLDTHSFVMKDVARELSYTVRAKKAVVLNFSLPRGMYYDTAARIPQISLDIDHSWDPVGTGTTSNQNTTPTFTYNSQTPTGFSVQLDNPFTDDRECDVTITIHRDDAKLAGNYDAASQAAGAAGDPTWWTPQCVARLDLDSIYINYDDGTLETDPEDETTRILTRVPNNFATRGLQQRKVQCLCTRYVTDNAGTYAVRDVGSILYDICLDPWIGRLTSSATDMLQWGGETDDVLTQMNTDLESGRVDIVFDKLDTSFEDIVTTLAASVFCSAYRVGEKIQFKAEVPQTIPVLLFNHRNKIPGTEARTTRFGVENDHDGAYLAYTDADDNHTKKEVSWPTSPTPTNRRQLRLRGVQDADIATYHVKRAWNRMRYQHTQVSFEATQEAALLVPGDLIMVADNTRPEVQDGDLVNISGAVLTLSQPVDLVATTDYVIFLQDTDGTVDTYSLTGHSTGETDQVTVTVAPTRYSVGMDNFARTTFLLVEDPGDGSEGEDSMFLVESVEPANKMTYTVTARNYEDRLFDGDPT